MLRKIIQSTVHSPQSTVKDLLLCLFSAVLLISSFPRLNIEFFAWIGFAPLFFVLKNKSKRRAFLLSYLSGIIFWSGIIYWLIHVTLPGTILLVLYLALYFGIFGLIVSSIVYRLSSIDQLLFVPAVWVLLEYIRAHLFTGFPWALLGYSQYLNLPIIQIADLTGVWGVSFLVLMANTGIYKVISYKLWVMSERKRLAMPLTYLLLASLLLFSSLGYGFFRLNSSLILHPSSFNRVSVIQGNVPQELKWDSGAKGYVFDRYSRLTKEAASLSPDLILWPQASSPGLLGEDNLVFQEIFALSKKTKTPLLIGTVARDNEKYFNSALLINPSGEIAGRYDKLHLVPFGEYIPLKKILPFLETIVPIGDITAGKEYTLFRAQSSKLKAQSKFGVLICFEDLFPQISREFVKSGANFLVNITNDAWYKKTAAASQHLQASVFRAVENRVFLARSANTGVSGFINPTGKIISKVKDECGRDIFISGFDTEQLSVANKSFTIYTRYGDFFPIACFLFALSAIISPFKSKR